MIDLVVSTIAFVLVVALLLAAAVAVTVVPLYAALQMADARRFSTARWGALSAVAVVVGTGCAYVLHKGDAPEYVALLPLALTWAAPAALWLLDETSTRIGGRAGRHE